MPGPTLQMMTIMMMMMMMMMLMMMGMTGINFSGLLVMKICTVFVSRTSGSVRCLVYINIELKAMYPDS
jgi:hypothetical protein